MEDSIFLCRCKFAVDEKNGDQVISRSIPKVEFCLNKDGLYYNMLDFKKYKLPHEYHDENEEYIVEAVKLDESQLSGPAYNTILLRKQALANHLAEVRRKVKSISEYLDALPRIDFIRYSMGRVILVPEGLAIEEVKTEEPCLAVLIKGKYYNITSGKEITVLNNNHLPGDIAGYNFRSVDTSKMNIDDYMTIILAASMIVNNVCKDEKVKIYMMR